MKTKRDKTRDLIRDNETKKALKNCKGFDLIYSKNEIRIISIAYECFSGNEAFYKALGVNTDEAKEQAKELLNKMM